MAKDIFHDAVVVALQNEGWTITHDPYTIGISETVSFYIDIGAEKLLGAEKEGNKIAVEVKSFVGNSTSYDFHNAIGQFIDYFVALEEKEPDRVLFLAVPETTYVSFFLLPIIQKALKFVNAKLIIYQPNTNTIKEWIK